jgi:hypothetical protein
MRISLRRLLALLVVVGGGIAALATAGLTSSTSAATPGSDSGVPVVPTPTLTACNGPTVNADRTVTYCLTAPQASGVVLQLQSMFDKAPTGIPYPIDQAGQRHLGDHARAAGPELVRLRLHGGRGPALGSGEPQRLVLPGAARLARAELGLELGAGSGPGSGLHG